MIEVMFGAVWTATTVIYVWVTAAVTDSFVFPSVGLGVLVIIGGYVWKFTRRADRVMLRTLQQTTTERDYYRDESAYYREWVMVGHRPDRDPPKMSDYHFREVPDNDGA